MVSIVDKKQHILDIVNLAKSLIENEHGLPKEIALKSYSQILDALNGLQENHDLWCVHILGSDDIFAAVNYRAAVMSAHLMQIRLADVIDFDDPSAVLLSPRVIPWTGTAKAHEEAIARDLAEAGTLGTRMDGAN